MFVDISLLTSFTDHQNNNLNNPYKKMIDKCHNL